MRTLAVIVLGIGCADGGKDTGPVDDGQPHIAIVSPDEGATVGGCFDLEVEVRNFTLVSPVEESEVVDGHGHYHAVFGDRYFDCESASCDIALTSDTAGDVTVVTQLVDSTHVPIENDAGEQVTDTRTFSYTGEPCPME